MHLLSCKHPKRVWNKYTKEYVFVDCGKCSICKNRRAARYTNLLERERANHPFAFFVTLTFDDEHLPLLVDAASYDVDHLEHYAFPSEFVSQDVEDNICISFDEIFPPELYNPNVDSDIFDRYKEYSNADIEYFDAWIAYGGLPYVSKRTAQLFCKRLNKYIHDHITGKYQNFRYAIVSEYGSTTFRPHLHGTFYCDSQELADQFGEAISACWQLGISDCQPCGPKATAYVAQYINKSADLPYVYRHRQLQPFFLCSRNPFIGTVNHSTEYDATLVNESAVTQSVKNLQDGTISVVPLSKSYQNKLFPKCPLYGSVSDTVRTELYRVSERFKARNYKEFIDKVYDYVVCDCNKCELAEFLRHQLSFRDVSSCLTPINKIDPLVVFDDYSVNWLRRLYYVSRKVCRAACVYGISVTDYICKIYQYYANKELYLLKQQYDYQETNLDEQNYESVILMYPDFLYKLGYNTKDFAEMMCSDLACAEMDDADSKYLSNKKCHYKNAYLESLQFKASSYYLYQILKTYFYAKKCNETIETLAP